MTRKSRGLRSRTRNRLAKDLKAKFTVEKFMKEFKPEDKVVISIDPTSMRGMPHARFKGMAGIVREQRGAGYAVEVMVGSKKKLITTRPEHLSPVKV